MDQKDDKPLPLVSVFVHLSDSSQLEEYRVSTYCTSQPIDVSVGKYFPYLLTELGIPQVTNIILGNCYHCL